MEPQDDPFDLSRFVIFPQVAGLGMSSMSQAYAVTGIDEARAYLAHPLLGPRLRACFDALLAVDGRTADAILGAVDAVKVRSSATLFAWVSKPGSVFHRVLAKYYGGAFDKRTLELLRARKT